MKKALFLLICSGVSSLLADPLEAPPWLPPPGEVQASLTYFHESQNKVSPASSDPSLSSHHESLRPSLCLTLWPHWNLETELRLTHTHPGSSGYEAALLNVRYALWEDITGDPLTLTLGGRMVLVGSPFLRQIGFPYHGKVNVEGILAVGKEWQSHGEWSKRLWGLLGYGAAEQGSAWLRGYGSAQWRLAPSWIVGLFGQEWMGLGHSPLTSPFEGYARLHHQSLILGTTLKYERPYGPTYTLWSWYNLSAANDRLHFWGLALSLTFLFPLV